VAYLDDYTFEEIVELQGRPGRYMSGEAFVEFARAVDGVKDESTGRVTRTYALEEGELIIFVYTAIPRHTWICAPLTVSSAASG
jgi:hypothetical protein